MSARVIADSLATDEVPRALPADIHITHGCDLPWNPVRVCRGHGEGTHFHQTLLQATLIGQKSRWQRSGPIRMDRAYRELLDNVLDLTPNEDDFYRAAEHWVRYCEEVFVYTFKRLTGPASWNTDWLQHGILPKEARQTVIDTMVNQAQAHFDKLRPPQAAGTLKGLFGHDKVAEYLTSKIQEKMTATFDARLSAIERALGRADRDEDEPDDSDALSEPTPYKDRGSDE
ncbi:hypothetical protein AAVH_14872 [Aphelenchoides avenae]|nr:hypothetical protein AAVH_14872 [Aphelenchus avenae]